MLHRNSFECFGFFPMKHGTQGLDALPNQVSDSQVVSVAQRNLLLFASHAAGVSTLILSGSSPLSAHSARSLHSIVRFSSKSPSQPKSRQCPSPSGAYAPTRFLGSGGLLCGALDRLARIFQKGARCVCPALLLVAFLLVLSLLLVMRRAHAASDGIPVPPQSE